MTDSNSSQQQPAGGLRALVTAHPTAFAAAAAGVVFVLLGTAAVFAGISVGSANQATVTNPAEVIAARTQPVAYPSAVPIRTCSVVDLAASGAFPSLVGIVTNVATGAVLFNRAAETPAAPAHIVTAFTAAAALHTLGADTRLSTTVVDGSAAGTIVLVGGGDPTLASTSASFYRDAPQLDDLASQAMTRYQQLHPGTPITTIVLDSSLWSSNDAWDANWPERERSGGYHSAVTALMVDGDRADPTIPISPRGSDPVKTAGKAFAQAAGLSGVNFTIGTAGSGSVLAEVRSQPVRVLVEQMLLSSDDSLAESLARLVSKKRGFDGSASSLAQSIPGALTDAGLVSTEAIVIADGSGLSPANQVSPQFVAQFMAAGSSGSGAIASAVALLPTAGVTGDLYNRFEGDAAAASGSVSAKSGWTHQEHSLAGLVTAKDGTKLAFAFYAIGEGITRDARTALDNLVAGVYRCGNSLSNY
ncbi:MAG: D-alanyl-D-alanine carboxypeptidase/D-alanyl-D-alanine-endopeptidase [Rhodoglobus sp.]